MSTRLACLYDSAVAGRGRRFQGCCHVLKLFKSRAEATIGRPATLEEVAVGA